MSRLTSEERRRICLMKKQAGQQMLTLPPLSTEGADSGWQHRRQLHRVARALLSLALVSGGLLICAFAEFHAPTSLIDAFLPRW